MEIQGNLISILPERSGVKDGVEWKNCELIVEQKNKKKDKILLVAWGQAVDDVKGKENNEVEVSFYISAREYKGRWYNQCTIGQIRFPGLYNDIKPDTDMSQELVGVPEGDNLPF
jgi:hypothetical protein